MFFRVEAANGCGERMFINIGEIGVFTKTWSIWHESLKRQRYRAVKCYRLIYKCVLEIREKLCSATQS